MRGEFDRFLMIPWNVCQNPSCYKKRAALAQAANRTRDNVAAVSFSSSFFVVFVVFIPKADRGVVYMRVLENFGRFGGFVATGLGRFEHVRRR